MIRVRIEQRRGTLADLPARIEVRGHAEPDRPRTGPGSRPEGQHGAPIGPHHLAIARSIARRAGRELVSASRSGRGVAVQIAVGVPLYERTTRQLDTELGYYDHRETTTTPRGRGWRRAGYQVTGSCTAIIEKGG